MNSSIERVKRPRWTWRWGSSPLTARMKAGVGFNLLGAAFNQGSTLIVNVVVANLLGREAFGRYTMVLATLSTLATIGQLAMGYTATKHVAEFRSVDPAKASRILGLCAVVSLVSALIAGLALAASAPWLARVVLEAPDLGPLLRIVAAAVFFTVLNGFFAGALAGLERYSTLAKAGLLSGTLYAVLGIALANIFGLTGAVAGVALSAFTQCVVLRNALITEAARQGVGIAYRDLWRERAIVSTFAVPASLTGLITLPALWISNALLARQPGGYNQLALFGVANSFRTMVLFVPQVVNNVGMSLLSNQSRSSAEGYRRVFWMNAAWTTAAAIGIALPLFLASRPLLDLFGPTFDAGRPVLEILLAAAIVEAGGIALYQIVVSRGRMWGSLFFVSLPRDLALVLVVAALTPALGAVGLATAYVASSLVALVAVLGMVSRLGVSAAPPLPVSAR